MGTYTERLSYTGSPEYDRHFWNAMRGNAASYDELGKGRSAGTGLYAMPNSAQNKYMAALEKESLFRNIGTTIKAYGSGYRILAKDSNDLAQWVAENDAVPIYDGIEDFTINVVDSWKLASLIKMDAAFIHDASFDIENYLINRFAKNFGRAEDNAFINGNGAEMPTGILNATGGADVAATIDAISYDEVISLYFSVKPEYLDFLRDFFFALRDCESGSIFVYTDTPDEKPTVSFLCDLPPKFIEILEAFSESKRPMLSKNGFHLHVVPEDPSLRLILRKEVGYDA